MKMTLQMVPLFFGVLACQALATLGAVRHHKFVQCPTNKTTTGQSSVEKSRLSCVIKCSQSSQCQGVAVCPQGGTGHVTCDIMADISPGQCLQSNVHPNCRLIYKAPTESSQADCENGGVLQGDMCRCPLPHAGARCERYMRDCLEGAEYGRNSSSDGLYLIQPVTSSSPFTVICQFAYNTTYAMVRQGQTWSTKMWAEVKDGFGDLTSGSHPTFFVGLERLRELLSQADYKNSVFCMYNGYKSTASADYINFVLGDEASGYQPSYERFESLAPEDNMLNAAAPVLFHTADRDPNGCARSNGGPGWYGADCAGVKLFHDPPVWSIAGKEQTLDYVSFSLYRRSPF